jgi:Icc-related predicted phosphoesterase
VKILMAGDTHGDGAHVRYLLQVAQRKGCSCIFVLGDFGYWEHMPQGVNFLDRANLNANLKNIPIYFLDGNHDKTSLLLEKYDWPEQIDDEGFLLVRPYVRYARRGHAWNWDGVRFIALGGAYSVDKSWRLEREDKTNRPESLWFPEEEMTDEDMDNVLTNQTTQYVDVMLAHDKPFTSEPDWNRKHFDECLPNQHRLQRAVDVLHPLLYLHGHLHFRYSDEIGTEHFTQVEGLDCNTADQSSMLLTWKSDATKSWYILDTEEVKK